MSAIIPYNPMLTFTFSIAQRRPVLTRDARAYINKYMLKSD